MFMDTTLRDGHQSLIATRMRTSDMIPALSGLDSLGFDALEVWGGATFDVCVRFLLEDPWDRIRKIKENLKKTPTQMLLRGQNLVGYRHYADDVVELFVKKAKENGVDRFRIFDALNDIRNLEKSIESVIKFGGHAQGAICYTVSPVHTDEYYLKFAEELVERGVHSVAIKDMAGLLTPRRAYDLVRMLKKRFDIPIQVHTHCTTGMCSMTYLAAVEAGADTIDTALSPFSSGTSQPPFESLYHTLREYGKVEEIDEKILQDLVEYFKKVREKYSEYDIGMKYMDYRILRSQVPGGMYSNLVKQLKEQGMLDKLGDVLEEIPRVRREFGYPPLVTPISQIVGVQATINVLTGKRYSKVTKDTVNYFKGMYGKPPAPVDEELRRNILGNEKPIGCRPADLLEPEVEKSRKDIGLLAKCDEDLLIHIIIPVHGKKFLEMKYYEELGIDLDIAEEFEGAYPV